MTAFHFRAVSGDDRPESGVMEAPDIAAATRQLLDRGLYPLDITRGGRSIAAILATQVGGQSLSTTRAAQLLADLGHLVRAEVEVAAALALLAPTAAHVRVREVIEQLLAQVRLGRSLSEAMESSSAGFPAHAIAAVRAGEMSGSVASALLRVSEGMRRMAALRMQVHTALIYPSCVAAAVAVALLVLVGVVVPTLESIFADGAARLPWQARFLVGCGHFVRDHALLLFIGAAGMVAAAVLALRNDRVRIGFETVTLRIPVLGPLLAASETARVATMLSLLAAAGLPLVNAVTLSRDGGRMRLTKESLGAAALRLREGEKLYGALKGVPTLSSRVLGLVRIGEATGRLGVLLEEAARDAEHQVETAVQRVLALLTPAMTLTFGGIAGFVLYTVMMSILSVNNLAIRPL